ncbi:hypothetical protein ONZ45_g4432 [Pleurotus djamor]|nr:hypothetical protein ONZ45_g4432 [Pleurotus djamor]
MSFAITKTNTFGQVSSQPTASVGLREMHWSIHCANTTQRLLEDSPLYAESPAYDASDVYLDAFIENLIRHSPVPRSASLATLTLINWITERGLCPLASSSAHHLFAAAYIVLVRGLWEVEGLDEELTSAAACSLKTHELDQAKLEVSKFFDTVTLREWSVIGALLESDQAIDKLFQLECEQAHEDSTEFDWLDNMEEDLIMKGIIVFEQDDYSTYQVTRESDFLEDSNYAVTTIIKTRCTKPEEMRNINDIEVSESLIRVFEENGVIPRS